MGPLGIVFAYLLDLALGDPEWFPHPVRGIGRFIVFLERQLIGKAKGASSRYKERIKGVKLVLIVVLASASFAYLFIEFFKRLHPFLGTLAWVYLAYVSLSIKDMRVKAKAILKEIEKDAISQARKQLSKIVGRDTKDLSKDRVIVAAVESIAESTNDGMIAPLFYLSLGGPVLAFAYKVINTLDSMVGYKNERYLNFGWFSAKLDDIVNFIPARISGFFISISSFILGRGFGRSFKTMLKDGRKHSSPNSGISEAAMAGALGIRLGGDSFYQGKRVSKPYLGQGLRKPNIGFINEALRLSLVSSILMVIIGAIVRWAI